MKAITPKQTRTKFLFRSILFCFVFTGFLILFSLTKAFLPNGLERLAHGIIGTLAALATTVLFLKIHQQKFSSIRLVFERNTLAKFFLGIIVGVLIMGLLATGVLYFTHAKVEVNQNSNLFHFLLVTSPLLFLAFMEELAFRAYPLEILKNKIGVAPAIGITSILFALYHLANGWTFASAFLGPAIWGLLFGLAAIYSKGIAMPTGIHYAANLTTSALGDKNTSSSLWIVKQTDTVITTYKGIDLATILPSLVLLILVTILFLFLQARNKPLKRQ